MSGVGCGMQGVGCGPEEALVDSLLGARLERLRLDQVVHHVLLREAFRVSGFRFSVFGFRGLHFSFGFTTFRVSGLAFRFQVYSISGFGVCISVSVYYGVCISVSGLLRGLHFDFGFAFRFRV